MWHAHCPVWNGTEEDTMKWSTIGVSLCALGLLGCTPRVTRNCSYDGMVYGQEARSCQPSQYSQYRCDDGQWKSTGVDCAGSVAPVASARSCELSGYAYANGSASCQAGTEYTCENGVWRSQRVPCAAGDAPYTGTRVGRSCMFGNVVEANDATICRGDTLYQCRDGDWVSLATACRY